MIILIKLNLSNFIKMQAGSSPTVYSLRNLKDGYKVLEENYSRMSPTAFRDAYVMEYGQMAWDKRQKIQVDDVVSRDMHFEISRPDLSSK